MQAQGAGGSPAKVGPTGAPPWETWGPVWGLRGQRPSLCPSALRAREQLPLDLTSRAAKDPGAPPPVRKKQKEFQNGFYLDN